MDKYFRQDENIMMSKLKGNDLGNLIAYLDSYYLELRSGLGLTGNETFGLELEFEKAKLSSIKQNIFDNKNLDDWKIVNDGSLYKGGEVVSPILTDTIDTWENLKTVCQIIEKYAVVGENTGGHIHVGTQVLGEGKQVWINF